LQYKLTVLNNGSAEFDGVFNMETGEDDILQVGQLWRWNYSNRTGFYEHDNSESGKLKLL
jgi:hypothetical protein